MEMLDASLIISQPQEEACRKRKPYPSSLLDGTGWELFPNFGELRIMPQHRRCVFGCANFITLFPFPHNEPYPWLRQQWLEFTHFDEGGVFNNSRLCDKHFSDGCFENKCRFTAGFSSHLLLSKDAIPSIYTVGNSPPPKPTTRDFGCQCVVLKKTAKVQANLKPHIRSAATQTRLCSESVGVGPPVDWKRSPSLLTSTYPESFQPSKKCRLTLDDDECDGDSIEVTLSKWRSQQLEKAVPSGDALNSTNDAIAEIIDFSDESDSSDEGSSKVDEEEHSSDSSDIGHDHNYLNVFDPLEHHNTDDKLPDEGPDAELDSGDHNSDIDWDLPDSSESDTDEKHDNLRKLKLCSECGMFFYSQAHTCRYKKPLSCIVCGKRYYCEVNLKIHSKIHQDGYKHGCKYCCATFRTRPDKLVHEQSHLPAQKPYQCPDCPEVFAKMRKRNDHLVTHRGPKRHICLICNMDFPSNYTLERHVAVHTKVKKFVCEVCQRSFTQSNHLKSHMRVHTGEKPYQCHHCDTSFNHNVSLKSHIQRYHGQVPDPGMKIQMEKTSRNESETEKDESNEMESSAVDAEQDEGSTDTLCNTENGAEEEVQKEDGCTNKYPRPTGRPRGRPKKNAVNTSDDVNQLKRPICIGDENEEGQGSSDSAEEEQEHDSDSDFGSAGQRSKKKNMAQSCKVRGREQISLR